MPLAAAKAALKTQLLAIMNDVGDPTHMTNDDPPQPDPIPCPTAAEKAADMADAINTFLLTGVPMTVDSGQTMFQFSVVTSLVSAPVPNPLVPISLTGTGGLDTPAGVGMATVQAAAMTAITAACSDPNTGSAGGAADAIMNAVFTLYAAAQVQTQATAQFPVTPAPCPPPVGPMSGVFNAVSSQGGLDNNNGGGLDKDALESDLTDLLGNVEATNTANQFAQGLTDAAIAFAKTAKIDTVIAGTVTSIAVVDPTSQSGTTTPPATASGTSTSGVLS